LISELERARSARRPTEVDTPNAAPHIRPAIRRLDGGAVFAAP
jgi:hypothetical protein